MDIKFALQVKPSGFKHPNIISTKSLCTILKKIDNVFYFPIISIIFVINNITKSSFKDVISCELIFIGWSSWTLVLARSWMAEE